MTIDERVLLLDAAWTVDRIINAQDACELILEDRATAASEEIVAVFHSPSIEVVIPSVLARIDGVICARHFQAPHCSRPRVRQRDRHTCQFKIDGQACTSRASEVDHLMPRSRQGGDTWLNLVAACRAHNGFKANRSLDEMTERFGWTLQRQPFVPTPNQIITLGPGTMAPAWEPFLVA